MREPSPVYAFTQQKAVWVKWQTLSLRLCTVPDDHLDKLTAEDGGHRWFCYVLDAAARGFPVSPEGWKP